MKWDDLERELLERPGVRKEIERLYPYDAVALAISGLRAEREMTQTEFGRLIGVPQSSIARLESGKQAPSVATLKRIAMATDKELVIEFRGPKSKRERPAKRGTAAASSAGDSASGPLTAAADD